jgi:hypothetical protein
MNHEPQRRRHTTQVSPLAFVPLLCLALAACGDADTVEGGVCDPLLRDCTCDDGSSGVQQCNASGQGYGACVCESDLGDAGGGDTGTDMGADVGNDMAPDAAADAGLDADVTGPGGCVDATMDCSGELTAPSCEDGLRTSYRWACDEDQRCVEEPVTATCDFGCAPPARGPVCARLAYATATDDSGSLCVVASLDDTMPQCFGAAGHHVAWNPEDPSLLAFTAFAETPWAAVGDLDATDRLCELHPVGRTPPIYAAGSWLIGGAGDLLMFEGDPEAGFAFSEWTYDPEAETCLGVADGGCSFVSGETYDTEAPFIIFGSVSAAGDRLLRIRQNIAARTSLLITTDIGEDCEQTELARIDDATVAGWQAGDLALFVANGDLYRLDVSTDERTRLTNAQTDDWSRGAYVVVDFSWDGSFFVAETTDVSDTTIAVFRIDGDAVAPWPASGENAFAGPAHSPSIERFQAP